MKRTRLLAATILLAASLLGLSACGTRGVDGEAYLALAGGIPPGRDPTVRSAKRELDPGSCDLDHPEEFRWAGRGPGWSLTVEGRRYRLLEP